MTATFTAIPKVDSEAGSLFTRDFLIAWGAAFCFFMVNFSYFSTLPLYFQSPSRYRSGRQSGSRPRWIYEMQN